MKFGVKGCTPTKRVAQPGDVVKATTGTGNIYLLLAVKAGFIVLRIIAQCTSSTAWPEWSYQSQLIDSLGSCKLEFCDEATLINF